MRFSTLLIAGLVPLSLAACATAPSASAPTVTAEALGMTTLDGADLLVTQTVEISGTEHICKRANITGGEVDKTAVICGTPRQWRAYDRNKTTPRRFRGAPIQGAVGQ